MASRFGFGTLLAAGAASCGGQQTATQSATSPVERGRYLVAIGGCNDCHTPRVMTGGGLQLDTARLLSGHRATEPPPAIPAGAIRRLAGSPSPQAMARPGRARGV